jgi:hypothetical protein
MQKYEVIRSLYEFLAIPKNSNKHLGSDNFGWTMVEFMHQHVMEAIRATMGVVWYIFLSYDEVS